MTNADPYAVGFERGPTVELDPHPLACSTEDELYELCSAIERPLVADLFCGAGGFSLGLEAAGLVSVVGVDFDAHALATYRSLFPGLALDWDLGDPATVDKLVAVLGRLDLTAIVGGPPCQPFSRAGRAVMRVLAERGLRDAYDHRRDLWQSFLEIVERVAPPIVMMENVPDLGLSDEGRILRVMIERLERAGYGVDVRLIEGRRFKIPQLRPRLILVALKGGKPFEWPDESAHLVTVANAIGDLPPIEGGWNEAEDAGGYLDYVGPPRTDFQRRARAGLEGVQLDRIYDHITRAVREDDRLAFAQMDSATSYAELDSSLKRYRDDIFDDKYKRLDPDNVSRTIIAHLAKDGYGFIHPTQDRTISVREAARLQTFPDHVRFSGPPTHAFRQIGNAVPPALAEQLGEAALASAKAADTAFSTSQTADALARWYLQQGPVSQPWLIGDSVWKAVVGEIMLIRADSVTVRSTWPVMSEWASPQRTLSARGDVSYVGELIGRPESASQLLEIAHRALEGPDLASVEVLRGVGVGESSARLIALASDGSDEDLMFTDRGVLRVVARFFGSKVDRENQRSQGRIEAARLVGGAGHEVAANLALVELARSVCLPDAPLCGECPLASGCSEAATSDRGLQARMF